MNANEMIDKLLVEGKINEEQAIALKNALVSEEEDKSSVDNSEKSDRLNEDSVDDEGEEDEDEDDDDDDDEDEDDDDEDDDIVVDFSTSALENRINKFGEKMGKLGEKMGELGEQLGKKYEKMYGNNIDKINDMLTVTLGKGSITVNNNGVREKKIIEKSDTPYDEQTVTLRYINKNNTLKCEISVAELKENGDMLALLDEECRDKVNQLLGERFTGTYKKTFADKELKIEIC